MRTYQNYSAWQRYIALHFEIDFEDGMWIEDYSLLIAHAGRIRYHTIKKATYEHPIPGLAERILIGKTAVVLDDHGFAVDIEPEVAAPADFDPDPEVWVEDPLSRDFQKLSSVAVAEPEVVAVPCRTSVGPSAHATYPVDACSHFLLDTQIY